MMKNKIYRSFEEIDTDLRILRLEKEIDRLSLTQQVSASVESLTLKNLLGGTWLSVLFKGNRWVNVLLEFGLGFLFRRLRR